MLSNNSPHPRFFKLHPTKRSTQWDPAQNTETKSFTTALFPNLIIVIERFFYSAYLICILTTYLHKFSTFPELPSVIRGWGYDRPRLPTSVLSVVVALRIMLSPRRGVDHRPRAATLLSQVAVIATFVAMSACMPGSSSVCPRSLDCARAGRHFCQPGSSHCGPCLTPLVENSHGRCILKRRHSHAPHFGKVTTFPEVDEEIDFLSTIISQQKTESGVKHPAPHFQDVSKVKVAEDDDRSMILTQRPTTELPTTHSATTAPPPTSITTANTTTTSHTPAVRSGPLIIPYPSNNRVFIIMSSVFVAVASVALLLAGVCWIRLQRGVRLAKKVDYPAYGGMGPHSYDNDVLGDKRLAQSAQMYHYQHQKQQMLCLEKHRDEIKVPDSGATSDEENEDGDFTVYECPGLAPTGEMEVKNPLFDDSTLYLQRSHK